MHKADVIIFTSPRIKWALVATCLAEGPPLPPGNQGALKISQGCHRIKRDSHEHIMPGTSAGTQQVLNKCLQDLKEFEKASWTILIHTDLPLRGPRAVLAWGAERKFWTTRTVW